MGIETQEFGDLLGRTAHRCLLSQRVDLLFFDFSAHVLTGFDTKTIISIPIEKPHQALKP